MTLEITPTNATLGAVVRGIRLAALQEDTFAAIERAWHEFAVLVFPGQHLSEAAQIAFSRRFGPLERSLTAGHVGASPEIIVLSNVRKDGSLWAAGSDQGLLTEGQQRVAHRQLLQARPGQGLRAVREDRPGPRRRDRVRRHARGL